MIEIWEWLLQAAERALGLSPEAFFRVFVSLLVVVIYLLLIRVAHRVIERRVQDVTRQYFAYKTTSYLLGLLVVITLFRIWIGGLVGIGTYLGILSAGLAIALQDPLTNLAGWLFIAVRRPFQMGDRIEIGNHAGDVISLRLFQFSLVEIRNWVQADQSTGRIIHIPNGWIFKHTLANFTQGFNFVWNEIPVTITFESDWSKAKSLLTYIANVHSILPSEEAMAELRKAARRYLVHYQNLTPIVWTRVEDHGVTLTIRYLCEPRRRRSTETMIWEGILKAFSEEEDIDFAYPTWRMFANPKEGKPGTGGPGTGGAEPRGSDSAEEPTETPSGSS